MSGGILRILDRVNCSRWIISIFVLIILLSAFLCLTVNAGEISLLIGNYDNEKGLNISFTSSPDDSFTTEDPLFGPEGLFESEELESEGFGAKLFVIFLILLAYVAAIGLFVFFFFVESGNSSGYTLKLSGKSRLLIFSFYLIMVLVCFGLFVGLTIMGIIIGITNTNYSSFFLEIFVYLFIFLLYLYLAYTILRKKPAVVSVFAAPVSLLLIRIEMSVFYPYFSEFQTTDDSIFFIVVTVITFIVAAFHHSGNKKKVAEPPASVGTSYYPDPSRTETGTAGVQLSNTGILDNSGFPVSLKDNYADISLVGTGGTARVFRAKRIDNGNIVALKIPLFFDDKTGKAFLREMRIWKKLSHANIVDVISVNILPVPYVEMEYIVSGLEEIAKPMDVERAVRLISGVADGLSYVHSLGFAHRDIKPKNILILKGDIPKITDWGLGKIMADGTETTVSGFSLNYAAPEQISSRLYGKSGVSTDIYQTGVLLYEMLTGRVPFSDGQVGIGDQSIAILNENPGLPSVVNPELKPFDAIIARCMQKKPEDRYFSIDDMMEDIRGSGFYK
ncbi:MAG: serine/threonine protein kinase [Methanomicrobiaceae archaeon]|nr:serine/threonine protein kinase [Methanomicrobiaceae archaeon]